MFIQFGHNIKFLFLILQYLNKQNTDLRDINESRMKIYEQLEISISDLEVVNKKLQEEAVADKATIKL